MMRNFALILFLSLLSFSDSFAQTDAKNSEWLAPVCKPKLYGISNSDGTKSCEAKFDYITEGDANGWIAMSSGKYGVINSSGNWIIKPNYETIVQFNNGRAVVGKKMPTIHSSETSNSIYDLYALGRRDSSMYYGVVDASNTWVIDPMYEFLRLCEDGSAQYTDGNGKFGFLNPDGTIMIRAQYGYASRMTNGVAVIAEPLTPPHSNPYEVSHRYMFTASNYFMIDRKGNKVSTTPHELIREFSEGRAAFNKGGIWKSRRYSESVRLVGGQWGFLDANGKEIIAPIYDYVYDFRDGKAKVRSGSRTFWIDMDGKECPPPLPATPKALTIFCEPGSYGYIDLKGNWVIEPQYYKAKEFSEGFAAVIALRTSDLSCESGDSNADQNYEEINGGYSKSMRYLLSLGMDNGMEEYQGADAKRRMDSIIMADSMQAIMSMTRRLFGYIDANGVMVLPAKYEVAMPFHNNRAYVRFRGRWGVINRKGEWVLAPVMDWPEAMSYNSDVQAESGIVVEDSYYSKMQSEFTDEHYDENLLSTKFYSFSEGIGGIFKYGKYGFADSTGKIIVPPIYDEAFPFTNGLAAVRHGANWGFVDKTGKEIIPLQFKSATSFSKEGLSCVGVNPNKKNANGVEDPDMEYESDNSVYYGYIDKTGKFAIKPQYIEAASFSEGLASVSVDYGKYGFIDKTGKFVIPPKYNYTSSFSAGYAQVKLNMYEPVYIDKNGKVSKVYTVDNVPQVSVLPLKIKLGLNTYYGFANDKGEEIIPCQFAQVGNFSRVR